MKSRVVKKPMEPWWNHHLLTNKNNWICEGMAPPFGALYQLWTTTQSVVKKDNKNTIWESFLTMSGAPCKFLMYFLIISWNNGGTAKFQPVKPHTSSGIWHYNCHLPTHHLTCHLYYTPKFPTLSLIATSVTCVVGPSVNTFFTFHIFNIEFFFFLPKHKFLQFVWISSNKIHSKINIFHTLALKIVKCKLY